MRSNRIWIFVLTALALLAFFAMQRGVSRAMKMKTESASAAQLAQLKPEDPGKVVLELTQVSAGVAEGRVLEKETETAYRCTNGSARFVFDKSTPIVMGRTSDLRTGAVVHISGKMGDDGRLRASQIVVLTGYVQVQ